MEMLYEWLMEILNHLRNSKGQASQQRYDFIEETKNELWPSVEELYKFFNVERNYQRLLSGEYGENLLAKYSYLANIECFDEWLDIVIQTAKEMLSNKISDFEQGVYKRMLSDLKYYLLKTRTIKKYFFTDNIPQIFTISLNYDFENWDGKTKPKWCPQKKAFKYSFSENARKIFINVKKARDKNFQIQLLCRTKGIALLYPALVQ